MKKCLLLLVSLAALSSTPVMAQNVRAETKIKPTDSIIMRISGVPVDDMQQISQTYTIASDGKFPLPYVGRILAAGMTPSQLGIRIEQAYKQAEIFTRPTVVVSTPESASTGAIRKISINGEVRVPQRAAFEDGMSLLDAIAAAGGFTDWADKGRVRILRDGKTSEHDVRKISVNPQLDVTLKPDDKIIVIHR
jgi:polysaccharide export outer membrane protein